MSYGTLLKINGISVKDPDEYEWQMYDVSSEDAGMTEAYQNIKDIQKTFRKLVCVWNKISFVDAAQLLKAVRNGKNPYLSVRFLDAETGTYLTRIMTIGDRSVPLEMSSYNRWEQIQLNFIERDGE